MQEEEQDIKPDITEFQDYKDFDWVKSETKVKPKKKKPDVNPNAEPKMTKTKCQYCEKEYANVKAHVKKEHPCELLDKDNQPHKYDKLLGHLDV